MNYIFFSFQNKVLFFNSQRIKKGPDSVEFSLLVVGVDGALQVNSHADECCVVNGDVSYNSKGKPVSLRENKYKR